jgi:excisionase family DNA binding protein
MVPGQAIWHNHLTVPETPYYKDPFPNITSCWTMMADKDDILLNSREVAFLLDLSPDTVNEFARRNILPAFKKGRQWRFRKRDIASFKRHLRGVNAAA